ncbi:MAG: hypothetical protein ACJAQT_002273 [Akkermansiaceae bacterium]|jgi:hypothetical protein
MELEAARNEELKLLQDVIYRDKVLRAQEMTPAEKLQEVFLRWIDNWRDYHCDADPEVRVEEVDYAFHRGKTSPF